MLHLSWYSKVYWSLDLSGPVHVERAALSQSGKCWWRRRACKLCQISTHATCNMDGVSSVNLHLRGSCCFELVGGSAHYISQWQLGHAWEESCQDVWRRRSSDVVLRASAVEASGRVGCACVQSACTCGGAPSKLGRGASLLLSCLLYTSDAADE